MSFPDDYSTKNLPPHLRDGADDDPRIQHFNDLAHYWRGLQNMLESVRNIAGKGMHSNLAVAQDLAARIDDVLSDADAFCALHVGDHGNLTKAILLLTDQAPVRAQAVRS